MSYNSGPKTDYDAICNIQSKPFLVNCKYLFFTYLSDSISINNLSSNILNEIDTIMSISEDGDHYVKYVPGEKYNSLDRLIKGQNYLLISKKNKPNYTLYIQTIEEEPSSIYLTKQITIAKYYGNDDLYIESGSWTNDLSQVYTLNDDYNGYLNWNNNPSNLSYNSLNKLESGKYYIFIKNYLGAPKLSPTLTPSITPTISLTPTITPTVTPTNSITPTRTATSTVTPTNTITPTNTVTPTNTATPTVTRTNTATPTVTTTITRTVTQTPTNAPVNITVGNLSWSIQSSISSQAILNASTINMPGHTLRNPGVCQENMTCPEKFPLSSSYNWVNNGWNGSTIFTFDPPIVNPVLGIFSLGASFLPSGVLTLSKDAVIYCNSVTGSGCAASSVSNPITMTNSKNVTAAEGFGIIEFLGSYNSIDISRSGGDPPLIRWGQRNITPLDVNGNLNPAGWVCTNPSDAFNFGTGDFTFECWVYPTRFGSTWTGFLSTMQNFSAPEATYNSSPLGVVLGTSASSSDLTFGINSNGAGSFIGNSSNVPIQILSWQHLALTRSSGICRMFINGNKVGNNIADARNVNSIAKQLGIGKYYSNRADDWMYNGYIDEVRISNIARYTNNFTPSSSEFSSDTNTVFLCHFDTQDSTSIPGFVSFTDSGPNNIGITGKGSASISSLQSKFGSASLLLGSVTT